MKKPGTQTIALTHPPSFLAFGNAVGKKEGDGPLGTDFDYMDDNDRFGQKTFEQAEREMKKLALSNALRKGDLSPSDLDVLFSGDLLNQCVSSSFAARDLSIPYFGLYGACSTMGEGLILASMVLSGGLVSRAAVAASSHFCTAERQYRTPLEYGGQRPPTAQWTVTGSGAAILGREGSGPYITHVTPGKVIDPGITDANNMGAAMAPAACDTIATHLRETGRSPDFYDQIITGDLGLLGSELLLELLQLEGLDIQNHTDCGALIFDPKTQDVHSGGSGCGCCASVLTAFILPKLRSGQWQNVLFCPTGALHSPVTLQQGESIPGICHAVAISNRPKEN